MAHDPPHLPRLLTSLQPVLKILPLKDQRRPRRLSATRPSLMESSHSPAGPRIILASQSPRRRELLATAGYTFDVLAPADDVECGVCSESGPAGLVAELALRKATAIMARVLADVNRHGQLLLAADTVAECDGFILGKPSDESGARAMLQRLSGREHRVYSGVCLWKVGKFAPQTRVAVTRLRMDALSDAKIAAYIASGQWEGKAGAFGYQDHLGWVHVVEGSQSNVVGLPMELLAEMISDTQTGGQEDLKSGCGGICQ
jgi:septum formation protein